MRIIIVGQGKLGINLTKQLSKEGHDIVVIDKKSNVVTNIVDTFDVMGICGNGINFEILKEAGAARAKLIIAATGSDEINILCCTFAKNMGTAYAIARVRNADYVHQAHFLREKIGIDFIVNPEYETANEIARIIRFPVAANLDTFAGGKVEIATIKVPDGCFLCDLALSEMRKKSKSKVLIAAVQRNDRVYIPGGDFVFAANDTISVTGARSELGIFMRQMGIYRQRIKDIMIIGGGKIGYFLARELIGTGREIKLIENNQDRASELIDALSDVTIINADGTDQDILDEQGIDKLDALVALTGIDEENIIVSMYANKKNIQKVITKVDRHSHSILGEIGLETVVSPQIVAGNIVTRYVRALQNSTGMESIQTLYKLLGGKVEAVEIMVPPDSSYENVPFKHLSLLPNILVACIIRKGKVIFPDGNDVLMAGDSIIVVTADKIIENINSIFA